MLWRFPPLMSKAPLLLRTLALTAGAGAVVFQALTSPSCDPHADEHSSAQHRAMTAGASVRVTANAENRPEHGAPDASTHDFSGIRIYCRKFAPIFAARRDFLLRQDLSQPLEDDQP